MDEACNSHCTQCPLVLLNAVLCLPVLGSGPHAGFQSPSWAPVTILGSGPSPHPWLWGGGPPLPTRMVCDVPPPTNPTAAKWDVKMTATKGRLSFLLSDWQSERTSHERRYAADVACLCQCAATLWEVKATVEVEDASLFSGMCYEREHFVICCERNSGSKKYSWATLKIWHNLKYCNETFVGKSCVAGGVCVRLLRQKGRGKTWVAGGCTWRTRSQIFTQYNTNAGVTQNLFNSIVKATVEMKSQTTECNDTSPPEGSQIPQLFLSVVLTLFCILINYFQCYCF